MTRVLIKNIYYLLLYAWNLLPEGRTIDVSGISSPDLPNLLAKVLIEGVHQLKRRGFDRGYVEIDEDLARPRGRMRLGDTLSRALLSRAQVACRTEDFNRNVLHNQIIKSTVERLARADGVDAAQRDALVAMALGLSDISSVSITSRDFGRIQLHGNNAFYQLLLRVCELVHDSLMPEPGTGRYRFTDVVASKQKMGRIFEDAVRNFFRLEQNRFNVCSERYCWSFNEDRGCGHHLVPTLNTDVSLFDGDRTIIIECKWTPRLLQERYHGAAKRLRSDHLYQLSTYMRHHERARAHPESVEGLLLYPLFDEPVDVAVCIHGQWLRVRTVNLGTDWEDIRAQLLALVEWCPQSSPSLSHPRTLEDESATHVR